MQTVFLPLALLLIVGLSWFAVRGRGMRWRAAGDAIALGLLTVPLLAAHRSPLLVAGRMLAGPGAACLRIVAATWWVAAARLAAVIARGVLEHDRISREARITADLVSGLLYVVTSLVIANFVLQLPVGGLVATSGVVAVVLGLALQNTLADVFSGIAVGVERPFGAGDRITTSTGTEGVVVEMNWRSVRIQTDDEDVATLPNSVIAKAQVINRSTPFKRRTGQVTVSCSATASPDVVLEILRRSAMLCPEVLDRPAPRAAMVRLGIRTAAYTLDFFVPDASVVIDSKTAILAHAQRQLRFTGLLCDGADAARPYVPTAEALVSDLPLFGSLSIERRAAITALMRRRSIEAHEVLFAKHSEADGLYVVAAGIIEMTGTAADVPSPSLRRVGPGDTLGDVGLLAGGERIYTARALTPCVVFLLQRSDLMQLIAEDEGLMVAIEQSAREHLSILESAGTTGQALEAPSSSLLQLVKRLIWKPDATPPVEIASAGRVRQAGDVGGLGDMSSAPAGRAVPVSQAVTLAAAS